MGAINEQQRELRRNKFRHHPPSNQAVVAGHEFIRNAFGALNESLMQILPDDPETWAALDVLDKACMQANAAMARTQGNPDHRGMYPEILS